MLKVVLFAAFAAFVAVLIAWYMQENFNPESLRGKRVVICGASTGIGEELAYQYAKFGAQLLLVARREAELKKVVARCGELGAESANYVVADLSSLEGAKHLAAVSSSHVHFIHADHFRLKQLQGSFNFVERSILQRMQVHWLGRRGKRGKRKH